MLPHLQLIASQQEEQQHAIRVLAVEEAEEQLDIHSVLVLLQAVHQFSDLLLDQRAEPKVVGHVLLDKEGERGRLWHRRGHCL